MDSLSRPSSDRSSRRVQLDPCYFVVATEGNDEIEYFKAIEKIIPKRFNAYYDLHIVPKSNEHHSSIGHIFTDLDVYLKTIKTHFRRAHRSSFLVFDHDSNFQNNHIANTIAVLRDSRQKGFTPIYSNPCFDLWLMLHYVDITERNDTKNLLENKNNYIKRALHSVRNGENWLKIAQRYSMANTNSQKLISSSNWNRGDYPSVNLVTEISFLITDIIDAGILPP